MDKITEFLMKNEYILSIKPIKGGVEVVLPQIKNKIFSQSQKTIRYLVKRGKNPKVIVEDGTKTAVEVPNYAIKHFIFYQILNQCQYLGYHSSNVVVYNSQGQYVSNGVDNADSLIKSPKGPDKQKEEDLTAVITEFTVKGDLEACKYMANELNILEGFVMLLNLLIGNKGEN